MFLFLHGLALLFGFLTGFSGGSGGPIHLVGGSASSPMDGGGLSGGVAPADTGGSMPGNGPGNGGGG